jgi:cytochrome c-type protein NapB
MSCHSWTKYREAGATKISQSHFEDRDNNVMANVAARRYFCTLCHVPQVDASPIVENTFEPLPTVK